MHFYTTTFLAAFSVLISQTVAFIESLPDFPGAKLGKDAFCKTTDGFPTEEQYEIGLVQFCDKYIQWNSNLKSGDQLIDKPVLATFDLRTYDDKLVRWVYRIDWAGATPSGYLGNKECKARFRALYTTDRAGGYGKAYCIVKGTFPEDGLGGKGGEESMRGEGAVVILGGTLSAEGLGDRPLSDGWFSFKAYERTG